MLLGIVGPLCSGKHTIAQLLVEKEGFKRLDIDSFVNESSHDEQQQQQQQYVFHDDKSLLAYVTTRWQERFVTCDIKEIETIERYRRRPFFLLLSVDAPILVRYARYQSRTLDNIPLELFLKHDDSSRYGSMLITTPNTSTSLLPTPVSTPTIGGESKTISIDSISALMQHADVHVSNHFPTVSELYDQVKRLDLVNGEWLRPGWDTYFMLLADLAALRSNCMKRRVGCILVKDHRVIATGYNGTPRGLDNCNENGCARCNSGAVCGSALDTCLCLHAEENALLEAGRERIQGGDDCTLYCNTCPCLGCAKRIVQVGIRQVVYAQSYGMDTATAELFTAAGVYLRQYPLVSVRLSHQHLLAN
ncbi:cytidine deaminase-like protein [Syncephalis fuscata]|nr:cytidine deaminase-like protein [Syncephalis fuscata]